GAHAAGQELADRFRAVRSHAMLPGIEPAARRRAIQAAEAAILEALDGLDRRMDLRRDDLRGHQRAILRARADGADPALAQHLAGAARLDQTAAVERRVDATGQLAVAIPLGLTVVQEEET